MRFCKTLIGVTCLGLLAACSSPEEDAAKAQKRSYDAIGAVAEERLKLVDEYRDCVADSGSDAQKIEACDTFLRAAEALK